MRCCVDLHAGNLAPGAPAGGIRLPIARACAEPPRAAQVNRALGVTRAARRGESSTSTEHGEDGEDAALTGASTVAIFSRDGLTPSQASSCSAAPTLPTGCVSKLAVKRPTITPVLCLSRLLVSVPGVPPRGAVV